MKKTIQFAVLSIFAVALVNGCISDNGKFPQPTAGFAPKQTYAVRDVAFL